MNLPEVVLIAESKIDLKLFYQLSRAALGRTVTRGIDIWSGEPSDGVKFLCSLDELLGKIGHPVNSVSDAGSLARHLFYTFVVYCSTDARLHLLEDSGLHIHGESTVRGSLDMLVISGNLEEYRTAITNLSTGRETQEVRTIANKVLICFEKMGLGPIWANWKRVALPDSTVKLLAK